MAKANLTAQRLRQVLEYDKETGVFTWREPTSRRVKRGDVAGLDNGRGYLRVGIDGQLYCCHRLAWLYVHGEWPANDIDHMNGDRADNRIANLRDVARSVNQQNFRRSKSTSTTGFLGVERNHSGFQARIRTSNGRLSLGTFRTPDEAHAAYLAAKRKLHEGCTI